MPWCSIDQEYQLGDIAIVPFERGATVADLNEEQCRQVDTILASYKTIEGEPIRRCALIKHSTKSIIDDLADGEINIAYDLVTLAVLPVLRRGITSILLVSIAMLNASQCTFKNWTG